MNPTAPNPTIFAVDDCIAALERSTRKAQRAYRLSIQLGYAAAALYLLAVWAWVAWLLWRVL